MKKIRLLSQLREAPKLKKFMKVIKHQNMLITALYSWIIFLVYEVTIRTYHLYQTVPLVDVAGHFLSGIAIAATLFWIFNKYRAAKKTFGIKIAGIKTFRIKIIWILISTLIIGFLWEILEQLQELIFYNPPYLKDVLVWDGIVDIATGLLGAGLFILIKREK